MVAEIRAWEAEDGSLHRTRLQAEAAEAQARLDSFSIWLGSRMDMCGEDLDRIVREIWHDWEVTPRGRAEPPI